MRYDETLMKVVACGGETLGYNMRYDEILGH